MAHPHATCPIGRGDDVSVGTRQRRQAFQGGVAPIVTDDDVDPTARDLWAALGSASPTVDHGLIAIARELRHIPRRSSDCPVAIKSTLM